MKNKTISIILILLAVGIALVIFADFFKNRPGHRGSNPYEYNIGKYTVIDPSLITYTEIKQIRVNADTLRGIAWKDHNIFIISDNLLTVINEEGRKQWEKSFGQAPRAVSVMPDGRVVVAFQSNLSILSGPGNVLASSSDSPSGAWYTSLACNDSLIFVADAGRRRVDVFDDRLNLVRSFKGESGHSELHGFIVPSACFDLALGPEGDLWVVNPGLHALQHYSYLGRMKRFWEKTSNAVEGFSGCCNPAHICFLPNGNFVTSEKGIVRIKEYRPSGELTGVVAPPESFTPEGKAPDITTDEAGRVMALDPDKKLIRIYLPK